MVNKLLPKPSPTNKQIKEYTEAVRKGINSQFIFHVSNGWRLHTAIYPDDALLFTSKSLALKKAKLNAKSKSSDIYIFSREGALIAEIKSSAS